MGAADLGAVERALRVRLPPALLAAAAEGRAGLPAEALLEPASGAVLGGRMPPDALPVAVGEDGEALLLRFDGWGAPVEALAWPGDGSFHPVELPGLGSPAARALAEARAALRSPLAALAEVLGRNALARDLGVSGEAFAGWLVDARLVSEGHRQALRRITGEGEGLFRQDWDRAGAAARRIAPLRPDLAWPGAVLGHAAEGRGELEPAARGYAAALSGEAPTLVLREPGRSCEEAAGAAAEAFRRCAGEAVPAEPSLAAALAGAAAVRVHHLAESDRLRAAGRAAQAYEETRRAGWRRQVPVDMDDVLGRMADAAAEAGAAAHAALAGLHLRCWMAGR